MTAGCTTHGNDSILGGNRKKHTDGDNGVDWQAICTTVDTKRNHDNTRKAAGHRAWQGLRVEHTSAGRSWGRICQTRCSFQYLEPHMLISG